MAGAYNQQLAFRTESAGWSPGVAERTVGDLVDPYRPGSALEVVNVVSRVLGMDAAAWSWDRLVHLAAGVEREGRGRSSQETDP